jgi:hypothetical protein
LNTRSPARRNPGWHTLEKLLFCVEFLIFGRISAFPERVLPGQIAAIAAGWMKMSGGMQRMDASFGKCVATIRTAVEGWLKVVEEVVRPCGFGRATLHQLVTRRICLLCHSISAN